MRTGRSIILAAIVLLAALLDAAAQVALPAAGLARLNAGVYAVTAHGPHHNEWESLVLRTNSLGVVSVYTNSYTELATGLNVRDPQNGEWVPSRTEIEPLLDGSGAIARKGQHQAFFPANIYTGAIELNMEGTRLRSRPLGLSYFDGTNSVLIAELTNSVGQIRPAGTS